MLELQIRTEAINILGEGNIQIRDNTKAVAAATQDSISIADSTFAVIYEVSIDISTGYNPTAEICRVGDIVLNTQNCNIDLLNSKLICNQLIVVTSDINLFAENNSFKVKYVVVSKSV